LIAIFNSIQIREKLHRALIEASVKLEEQKLEQDDQKTKVRVVSGVISASYNKLCISVSVAFHIVAIRI